VRPCLLLTTSDGLSIRATAEHPFLSPQTHRYEPIRKWADGTLTQVYRSTREGGLDPVDVVSCRTLAGAYRVFDIGVDSTHHNFVAEGLVVHNKSIAVELLMTGTWEGTCTNGSTGVAIPLRLELVRPAPGRVTGTARFGASSCVDTAQVAAASYGTLAGELTFPDGSLSFQANEHPKGLLRGPYRVKGEARCLGEAGQLELRRVDPALASRRQTPGVFALYRVDEHGVEEIGTAVLGR
jgi:hypothetical protein